MSNNPLRRDYDSGDRSRRLDSRGWLVGAAFALVLIGLGVTRLGGSATGLYILAVVLAIAGLVGLAVRD